jgi:hypothetical protein
MDAIPNQNISQSIPLFFLQKYVKSQTKERESDHKFIIALMWEIFNLSFEAKHIVTFFLFKTRKINGISQAKIDTCPTFSFISNKKDKK